MAAHVFLLLSSALLSALSQPTLSFDKVPALLERSTEDDYVTEVPYPAVRIRAGGIDGMSLVAEGYVPTEESPLKRLLKLDGWHHLNQHGHGKGKRKLLQSPIFGPYSPLSVAYNGKTCILFKAKRLAVRYKNHTFIDLTEKTFGPNAPVDTKGSICTKEKATLSLKFGDVEDLRGLVIRLQMSNTFYESAGQNWFTLDSVHIHYNWTHEATFNASEVYAPATSSYHCQHVSSQHKYDTLLVPSSHTDTSANWHITFTDFQIQAFNVMSDKFASASDCATFLTPAILMGLVTSLILLLVLAYALHMVVHLKHIDRYEEHKAMVYFPRRLSKALERRASQQYELPDKNCL
ncbi:V-type proton ATPase subunit S1-like protein [Coregonus clupeaformis]|uniref:V-type proton ATPase subunit S1-like protein n=1 Tax=Coregonus suidteri TaxID=861788 RepID=A0AAN8LHN2_9TELE|nr:V-type proton ATPase subunit S1-like protein [Coregonus clupeaformis]